MGGSVCRTSTGWGTFCFGTFGPLSWIFCDCHSIVHAFQRWRLITRSHLGSLPLRSEQKKNWTRLAERLVLSEALILSPSIVETRQGMLPGIATLIAFTAARVVAETSQSCSSPRHKDFSRKKTGSKSHRGCKVDQEDAYCFQICSGSLRPVHKNILILFLGIVALIMSDEVVTSSIAMQATFHW